MVPVRYSLLKKQKSSRPGLCSGGTCIAFLERALSYASLPGLASFFMMPTNQCVAADYQRILSDGAFNY